jgi:hypothetical protein
LPLQEIEPWFSSLPTRLTPLCELLQLCCLAEAGTVTESYDQTMHQGVYVRRAETHIMMYRAFSRLNCLSARPSSLPRLPPLPAVARRRGAALAVRNNWSAPLRVFPKTENEYKLFISSGI